MNNIVVKNIEPANEKHIGAGAIIMQVFLLALSIFCLSLSLGSFFCLLIAALFPVTKLIVVAIPIATLALVGSVNSIIFCSICRKRKICFIALIISIVSFFITIASVLMYSIILLLA